MTTPSATTEGGGKTPAARGGRNLRKPNRHHLKLWLEYVTRLFFSFFFPPFSYDLVFKGNCCGCNPCPGMRSWTLLKGLNKGTSVLELCGSPAMGDSIELDTFRTNGSHRDADLSEVTVSGWVQQLMIVRYCTLELSVCCALRRTLLKRCAKLFKLGGGKCSNAT